MSDVIGGVLGFIFNAILYAMLGSFIVVLVTFVLAIIAFVLVTCGLFMGVIYPVLWMEEKITNLKRRFSK